MDYKKKYLKYKLKYLTAKKLYGGSEPGGGYESTDKKEDTIFNWFDAINIGDSNIDEVSELMKVDPELVNTISEISFIEHGNTGLIVAAKGGHDEIVELLLDKGADPNLKDKDGRTALMLASLNGKLKIVELLLVHGADPNEQDKDGDTALIASLGGNLEIVKLLLDYGADKTIKNNEDSTALIQAVHQQYVNITELLLKNNTNDLEIKDKFGLTALRYAIRQIYPDNELEPGDDEMFRLLLNKGANINSKGENQNTALIEAIIKQNLDLVNFLLDNGADPNITTTDEKGYTPLMLATNIKNLDIVKALLKNEEIKIHEQDNLTRRTALMMALDDKYYDIAEEINKKESYAEQLVDINGVSVQQRVIPLPRVIQVQYLGEMPGDSPVLVEREGISRNLDARLALEGWKK